MPSFYSGAQSAQDGFLVCSSEAVYTLIRRYILKNKWNHVYTCTLLHLNVCSSFVFFPSLSLINGLFWRSLEGRF